MAKKNCNTWFPTWGESQANLDGIGTDADSKASIISDQPQAADPVLNSAKCVQDVPHHRDDNSPASQAEKPQAEKQMSPKNMANRRMSLNDETRKASLKPKASALSLSSFTGSWLGWSSKDTATTQENEEVGSSSPGVADAAVDPKGAGSRAPGASGTASVSKGSGASGTASVSKGSGARGSDASGTSSASRALDALEPDPSKVPASGGYLDTDASTSHQKPSSDASQESQKNLTKDEGESRGDIEDGSSAGEAQKRKSSWTFWNASEETAKKSAPDFSRATNKILKSTPSIPSKEDLNPKNKPPKADSVDTENSAEEEAVLYKPHSSASEFNKINTHKNENLEENGLVPPWNSCLRDQSPTSASATSSNILPSGGIKNGQAFDMKYWKSYLSHISARLGFSSSSDQSSEVGSSETQHVEKELNMLYERSYKLYGRALCKLPPPKRACLPNFSQYYTEPQEEASKRQKSQLEEDAENSNSISVTNDAMGNLLINYSDPKQPKARSFKSDIVNQRPGPLTKIKKVLIIGVHGFFPTRMIRPIIGAPKGTSLKFANEAEKAVLRYFVENDMISEKDSNELSIQKIALEKEGKIFDRVEFFLKILSSWKKELNEADFVFIACHSQGCVVSIILLAQLIEKGILESPSFKRLGVLGMAGINNGPFFGIDKGFFMRAYSTIEHDSMMELFELNNFNSKQSVAYKEAMQVIINVNVKVCFVGSINDQLVPLYSALASHVFHPNIYRACYIDQSSRTPEFVKQLVSMACQLQNMGYFDNNVIKEISPVLAGPLTGGGHSKIYNDGKVYDLGIKFFLDTDDMVIPKNPQAVSTSVAKSLEPRVPITNQTYVKEYNVGKIGTNPFILPWCLRGLIFNVEKNWRREDDQESRSGLDEIRSLYESFDSWRPDTKALKELKFRLNGIRASKL